MASIDNLEGGDVIKRQGALDDITTCCICTEVYTDPKALPCIHTFCMECIQETGNKCNKGPGDEMPCPLCRRLFKIPPEGFHGLPKNFFMEKLLQVSSVLDQPSKQQSVCDVCLDKETGKETSPAEAFCLNCKKKLCNECCRQHRNYKLTNNHELKPINENKDDKYVLTHTVASACEVHEQRVLDVYCADCKKVVCAICFIEEHNGHEGSHVSKCVDGFRRQMIHNSEAINEWRSQAEMKKKELLKVKNDIHKMVGEFECDVANRMDELKKLIDKHGSALLQDLSSTRKSKLKEIQMASDDVDICAVSLETYNSFCQNIMAIGSASDICRAFSDLSSRAMELQVECQTTIGIELPSLNVCFKRSEIEGFLEEGCNNLIGEIEGEQYDTYSSDLVLVGQISAKSSKLSFGNALNIAGFSITTKQTGEDCPRTYSIAILDKELFVVSIYSSKVEVYDSVKFGFNRQMNLKELNEPLDIVSCTTNQCLYILHRKGYLCGILKFESNGKLMIKWSLGDDLGVSMSVTRKGSIIVTVSKKHKLSEYSSDGEIIREIHLSQDKRFRHPACAIQLANGHFVISHGDCYSEDNLHRVCIVDAFGKVKKSFGGECGSSNTQLYNPNNLLVDSDGFVMVADDLNSRVLLFDSNLRFKREIITEEKHGLKGPMKMILDESTGRLFVVDNLWFYSGKIFIFDCK